MPRQVLRAAFYLWLSVCNLVAASTVWARLADKFTSAAAARLFGLFGAGATLGKVSALAPTIFPLFTPGTALPEAVAVPWLPL